MRWRLAWCAAVAATSLSLALAGCAAPEESKPTHTQDQSKRYPTATPLSEEQLFESASEVLRSLLSAIDDMGALGGGDELPNEVQSHVTGPLESAILSSHREWKEQGIVAVGEDPAIVWMKPSEQSIDGSVIAIDACIDGSRGGSRNASGATVKGSIDVFTYYFEDVNGKLKAFDSTYTTVQSC